MSKSAVPLVCICVPAYNAEKTLPQTLDSILGQTYRNLSVFVIDNASSDKTAELAYGYAAVDSRLRVFRNSSNIGGDGNLTLCLGLACGDYTAIFHSDDIYSPGMVGEQVAFLEGHPEAGAVFTMAQSIDENGVAGRVYSLPPELRRECSSLYGFDDIFRVLLKYGNFFFCPGVMARTPIYRDLIRVWDASGFGTSADLDVWLRILRQFPVGIIDKPLLRYRGAAATSFSYSHAREKTAPADMLKVFNSYISGSSGHLMGKEEHADYALLILKDNINRAFNLLCNGDAKAGRALLSGLFSLDNVTHSFRSYFHLRALLYGYSVYFLSWLPLGRKTLGFVSYFRFRK